MFAATLFAQEQTCKVELFIGDPEFYAGDGGAAVDAKLGTINGLEIDLDGTIYVSSSTYGHIRKIDSEGSISTIAGTGVAGNSGDGGPAIEAQLSSPGPLALSPDGSLYFVDDEGRLIRRITSSGIVESVAFEPLGDIAYLAVSGDGDVYYSRGAQGVFLMLQDGKSQQIAGAGILTAEGVDALEFDFGFAADLLVSTAGDILVADGTRVLIIEDGKIRTLIGGGSTPFEVGVGPLQVNLLGVRSIGEGADGSIIVAATNGVFSLKNGVVSRRSDQALSLLASSGPRTVLSKVLSNQILRLRDDDSFAVVAGVDLELFYEPGRTLDQTLIFSARGLQTDSQGRLYYFDQRRSRIFRTTSDDKVEVFAGGGDQPLADGVQAKQAALAGINDTSIDGLGRIYFSSRGALSDPTTIARVELDGTISILAGGGLAPSPGGAATARDINFNGRAPLIASTPDAQIYFDYRNDIYKVGLDGIARLIPGFSGYGSVGALTADRSGTLLASMSSGLLTYDDGDSSPTLLQPRIYPYEAIRATSGSLFYRDDTQRILRLDSDGRVTNFFPLGVGFEYANGQLAPNAGLPFALAMATNEDGDLFIPSHGLSRIFVIRNADTCALNRPFAAGIANGAHFNGFSAAPGTILSVFGQNLGPKDLAYGAPGQSATGTWQTNVGGLEILVNGHPAPIIFSRQDQAAFVVPNEVVGTIRFQYVYGGLVSSTASSGFVAKAGPGIFTVNSSGEGQAAALNQDSSINSPANPAAAGSVIVLYITGAGATNPPSVTGSLNDFPLPQLVESVVVTINNTDAVVEFAGPAPGLISGVFQINARIPADAPAGPVPVSVTIGGSTTPFPHSDRKVTISIQ